MMNFACINRPDRSRRDSMKISANAKSILTDSHFLVPLIVFCIGLALLITLH